MCGFGGIINGPQQHERATVGRVAGTVSFRGPDSCGIRIYDSQLENASAGNTALFFNRLAILDLDPRSDQPFEDGSNLLLFNGEIYNYRELKNQLQSRGVRFRTTSDTEVLFYGLKLEGAAFLPKVNGMFAFFWLNRIEKTFILGRDRLGIKPLYYRQNQQSLSFGSELHTIVRFSSEDLSVSRQATEMYLWLQSVPTPFSIIDGIHKLPPGTFIQSSFADLDSRKSLTPQPFWDAYETAALPYSSKSSDLEGVLRASIERQLHADVPLGLFLSSGVDSSLLAAMVNKYFVGDDDVNFFTVAFDENTSSDESRDAMQFIEGFKNERLKNRLLQVNADYIQQKVGNLYDFFDEPFGDPASLLNWVVSEKAREFVTVAISGDGADELFWGYSRYHRYQKFTRLNKWHGATTAIRSVASAMPSTAFQHKILATFQTDPVRRHFDQFLPLGMRFLVTENVLHPNLWAMQGVEKIQNRKDLTAILDIKTYLADAMLYKVDRASMASSLEVRVPFLDNEMVDYAIGLPFVNKSNPTFASKAILKELLVKLAPHYEVNRPKKGFNFPLRRWLLGPWKEKVLDATSKNELQSAGLDPERFYPVIRAFFEKQAPYYEHDVWSLFNLVLWNQKFKAIKSELSR